MSQENSKKLGIPIQNWLTLGCLGWAGLLLTSFFLSAQENLPERMSFGVWIEDSLQLSFRYPRAWIKKVDRSPSNMTVEFQKSGEIILRLDSMVRQAEWDVDRFIEENLDLFLKKYPDLKVIQELRLPVGYQGFEEAHFLVLHYFEDEELITNRILFARKGRAYFVIQSKIIRKLYHKYRSEVDLFTKSVALQQPPRDRWRNDSLTYLNPSIYESTIQYIQQALRPGQKIMGDPWLNASPENSQKAIVDSPLEKDPKRPVRDLEPGRMEPEPLPY
jgi:hypothetical protein